MVGGWGQLAGPWEGWVVGLWGQGKVDHQGWGVVKGLKIAQSGLRGVGGGIERAQL